MKRLLWLVLCAGAGSWLAPSLAATDSFDAGAGDPPLRLLRETKPVFPIRLLRQGFTSGSVRVLLKVNPEGQLVDTLVVGYTHREFADSVLTAVRQWKFAPAMINGEPVAALQDLTVEFRRNGVVAIEPHPLEPRPGEVTSTSATARFAFRAFEFEELDRPPRVRHVVSPDNPTPVGETPLHGSVRIEYYIDERGHVRMPIVVSADHARLGWAALAAIGQWRFDPPLRDQRPVLAHGTQVFRFVPGES